MVQITNKNIPVYQLDHFYVADNNNKNAERTMLSEAVVSKVIIMSGGAAEFYFSLAGVQAPIDVDELVLYYDIEGYRADGQKTVASYKLVSAVLEELGITSDLYDTIKINPNSSMLLKPKGFFINDTTQVEEVDFPGTWVFERTVTKVINEGVAEVEVSPWKHDANFYGKEIYPTREAALKNHKIKLLRLNGQEDEV